MYCTCHISIVCDYFKEINGSNNIKKEEVKDMEERMGDVKGGMEERDKQGLRVTCEKAFSHLRFPRKELCNSNGRVLIGIA